MKNNKVAAYLIPGAFLIYFGLDGLDKFSILYNGLALILGVFSVIIGIVHYLKEKKKNT